VEVVASLSQGHTTAAQCGLFTHKSVLVVFEPPCITQYVFSVWRNIISLLRESFKIPTEHSNVEERGINNYLYYLALHNLMYIQAEEAAGMVSAQR